MTVMAGIGGSAWKFKGFAERGITLVYKDVLNELQRTERVDDACKKYIGNDRSLFTYCRFNNVNGAETVALIGDSHAHASYPGIAEMLAVYGKNLLLLANSSCPTFNGAVTGRNEEEREKCNEKIDQILNIVKGRTDIKDVIIVSRGQIYLTGQGVGDDASAIEPIRAYGASSLGLDSASVFKTALQNTVEGLNSANKSVYYVMENPETGIDPRKCIPRPLRQAKSCGVSEKDVRERQAKYRAIVQDIKGVRIIDPLPAFCANGSCRVMDGEKPLYTDGNHLSVEGSRYLARNVLKDAMFNPSK